MCHRSLFLKSLPVLFLTGAFNEAKVYERCEFARELQNSKGITSKDLAVWVCIAYHESRFNTAAINHSTGDYGIFQISHLYWCSPPGNGCNISCSSLINDNISDDVQCAETIKQVQGFSAWVMYNKHCQGDVSEWTQGCF